LGKVLLSLGGEFQQVAASCCEPDSRKRPTDADEVLKALEYGKKRKPLPAVLIAASLIAAAALLTVVTGRHDEIKDLFESAVRLTNQAGSSAF
jgi:hypothetical protein